LFELLLDHGANVNIKDTRGYSSLYCALVSGNTNAIAMLLQHGANPRLKDDYGKTVLQYAEETKDQGIIQVFSDAMSPKNK